MPAIEPTGQVLGATVRGVDLSEPLSDPDFAAIRMALGRHGGLRSPAQRPEAAALSQVMADRIFDPAFVREALSAVASPAGAPAR